MTKSMDEIVALCRRRGFIWQSSEIYGGINGFWDYGPLGAELKRNLKDAWWHDIVRCPAQGPDGTPMDMVGLDTTIIMNPKVWEASGHVGGFSDPMVDCTETKHRFRADKAWVVGFYSVEQYVGKVDRVKRFIDEVSQQSKPDLDLEREIMTELPSLDFPDIHVAVESDSASDAAVQACKLLSRRQSEKLGLQRALTDAIVADPTMAEHLVGRLVRAHHQADLPPTWPRLSPTTQRATLTEPRQFNLMFETHCGAVRNDESKAYLRPETAQGIFTQFWNIVDTSRVKVPFGVAQIGKAFRNEVTPRNFTFRSREFEQMEIEFFIHPSEAEQWYAYWRDSRFAWWQSVGLAGDNLILREHDRDELAHYAKEGAGTSDIEYRFPFTDPGYGELEGVAHRSDFDLKAHATMCGKGDKMQYFDQAKNERYFPHVIEPSAGADRGTLALLCEAYTPDESRPSKVFMKFAPRMAPIKAAIFPLVNKEGMPEVADKLYKQLRQRWAVQLDVKQAIGKRYARMDEAGTPYCLTIDGDTLGDNTVTVRHRDTLKQERIGIDKVEAFLAEHIGG
jgi:glycyl-tRNA synthetase